MSDNIKAEIETARQELASIQAEIETLRTKKTVIDCIREAYSKEIDIKILKRKSVKPIGSKNPPVSEITILESDFQMLMAQAQSAAWIERKIKELKYRGEQIWLMLQEKEVIKCIIQRTEAAEQRCRALEAELEQLQRLLCYQTPQPPQYCDTDDGADREIDYLGYDDFERE